MKNIKVLSLFVFILLLGCKKDPLDKRALVSQEVFELLPGKDCGISFSNDLKLSTEMNIFKYMYFYNGGGVGSGDFNQDGLVDLFFTGNMVDNKLYLNKGNMQFEDHTKVAGIVGDKGWSNGVSVIDINQDGMLDIYISQVGDFEMFKGNNLLYVCQKIENDIPIFEEKSKEYGLDLVGFGTQAAFFDYDLDGDLDLFQLNHSLHANGTFGQRKTFDNTYHPQSGDKLYKNEKGKYIEVTKEAGILSSVIGYGLGVVVSDVNLDGYPDLYIGNDFHENDYLYINQGDGTFKEDLTNQIGHTSRFSMGVEASDFNNDAYPDIITLDMLPEDPYILKKSEGEDAIGIFNFKLTYGYNYQYARNCLQLNNGNSTFSEIALLSGVHDTDWSWSPLSLDINHDGQKDIFISNGIPKRMNDIDYINFVSDEDWQWKTKTGDLSEEEIAIIDKIPEIKIKNKVFLQQEDLIFKDAKSQIINDKEGYSNGACYADLDNDGDLDLVVNNINDNPFIYKNISRKEGAAAILNLKGPRGNLNAIGSKIIVFAGDKMLTQEKTTVRGFQSSSEGNLHLGLGTESIDSTILIWPDNSYQKIEIGKDTTISITFQQGLPIFDYEMFKSRYKYADYTDISKSAGLKFIHDENPFIEFLREPLVPHSNGEMGPNGSVGDVNGDGLDDVFIGGAKQQVSALYLQSQDGTFKKVNLESFEQDKIMEDVESAFVDIDRDGDLDLIVGSGGNEFSANHEKMLTRLYINDGKGNFERDQEAFGKVGPNTGAMVIQDFNEDGYPDVYLGARTQPYSYGAIPQSYLMINDGKGHFIDQARKLMPQIVNKGMVKDAISADLNGDGINELVVAYEWGNICTYPYEGAAYTEKVLTTKKGLWTKLMAGDFNQDGSTDILVGNLGLNTRLQIDGSNPIQMYYGDFDNNKSKEQILVYYVEGKKVPFSNMMELQGQLPYLKKKFLKAEDFAKAEFEEIFDKKILDKADVFEVDYLQNAILYNISNYQFELEALPIECQYAPIMSSVALEQKGKYLIGSNYFGANIQMGRYDAQQVYELNFNDNPISKTKTRGFDNTGEVRQILPIKIRKDNRYILLKNNMPIIVL